MTSVAVAAMQTKGKLRKRMEAREEGGGGRNLKRR